MVEKINKQKQKITCKCFTINLVCVYFSYNRIRINEMFYKNIKRINDNYHLLKILLMMILTQHLL